MLNEHLQYATLYNTQILISVLPNMVNVKDVCINEMPFNCFVVNVWSSMKMYHALHILNCHFILKLRRNIRARILLYKMCTATNLFIIGKKEPKLATFAKLEPSSRAQLA